MFMVAAGLSLAAMPALGQFGTIFRDDFPRPPGDIPDQPSRPPNFPPPPIQRDYPPARTPQRMEPPPARATLPPPGSGPRDSGIRSQPLPPPPGGTAAPPQARPQQPQAPGDPAQPPAAAAPAEAVPPDEVVVQPPPQRIVNPTAVFAGLDKITGRITSFDVAIDETVQFGALRVTPHACYSRPPTETPRTDAFIDVDEVTLQGEVRRIFTGWMFATSPGLHAVEHPIYDIWLTECKGGSLAVAESDAGAAPRQQAPASRAQQQQQRRR
jgi:hypothetical protein